MEREMRICIRTELTFCREKVNLYFGIYLMKVRDVFVQLPASAVAAPSWAGKISGAMHIAL